MPGPYGAGTKRPRDKYSRLICLGCRDRRIRCELPRDTEIPKPGELRTIQTPCYRCRRLDIPCIVRQTILGRPGRGSHPATAAGGGNVVSHVMIKISKEVSPQPGSIWEETELVNDSIVPLTKPRSASDLSPSQRDSWRWNGGTLLVHTPQSSETVFILRAIDTLRYERVEEEWFRHLPAYAGHTLALDLSMKALVAACAYKRGTPQITSGDCYQALSLALSAVQTDIAKSCGELNDDMLASTALLARFDGEIKKDAIPVWLHVEGLATILTARSAAYPVTQLARDIFDFHAGESAVMACIQGRPSPFENVGRAYFANDRVGCSDSDRAQLKALSNEIFIRLPRLVWLVRSLQLQPHPQSQLLSEALGLFEDLSELQDFQAEERLLQDVDIQISSDPEATSLLRQNLHFTSYKDFEALSYYWQSRLSLLRLELRLHDLCVTRDAQADGTNEPGGSSRPRFGPRTDEIVRLVKNIMMCTDYAATLRLNKHIRLFAHAMVVVWGATVDVSTTFGYHQEEKEAGALSSLLLRRANIAPREEQALTAEDMNVAADTFVGGQLGGRFAAFFGS